MNQLHLCHRAQFARGSGGRRHWPGVRVWLASVLLLTSNRATAAPVAVEQRSPQAEDRFLVKPRSKASRAVLTRFHSENSCVAVGLFPDLGDEQFPQLPEGATIPDMVRRDQNNALVEYAEPDYYVRPASIFPNDPRFLDGKQWGLNNAGQDGGRPNADIDAPEGWSTRTMASNVIVAVVDSGIRLTHEDLAGNLWTNPRDGSHGINALTGTTDPNDDNGHGTRVAGVIGAVGNNGVGVTGVAWRVQLMACKFANRGGYGTVAHALACLDYARTNGAHIINASWGLQDSLSLSNAMIALQAAGIIVVAAAGNGPNNIDVKPQYPASYNLDNIITVAATTRQDELYVFSNFGATNVDLAAPGDEIYSTEYKSDRAYGFDPSGQGDTSMATAYVSGVVALLRAAHPSETPAQIKQRLMAATDRLPSLIGKCVSGGRLNLRKALGVPVLPPVLTSAIIAPSDPFVVRPELITETHRDRNSAIAPDGSLTLLVTGYPGRSYLVETSRDLLNWSPVVTNRTGLTGSFALTNSPAGRAKVQFFRARLAR